VLPPLVLLLVLRWFQVLVRHSDTEHLIELAVDHRSSAHLQKAFRVEYHSALFSRWPARLLLGRLCQTGEGCSSFTEVPIPWAAEAILCLLLFWGLGERVEGRRMKPLQSLANLPFVLALAVLLFRSGLGRSLPVGLGLGLGVGVGVVGGFHAAVCQRPKVDQAFLVPCAYHLVLSFKVVTLMHTLKANHDQQQSTATDTKTN
jgi:hypothetical protein